ncbi:replicative DNA helicase, partial [Klebsiella michiganensis]
AIIYQEFKNGHFLSMDQHIGKEKTRIQLEAAKPRKQPRKYSEKFNTDAF